MVNCKNCGHKFEKHEWYVVTKENEIVCETCFFNDAIEKLHAKSKANGLEDDEYIDEGEEAYLEHLDIRP